MEYSKIKTKKLLFFVGLSLITGFVWGQMFAPIVTKPEKAQCYTDPQIPIGQFDKMVSIDIIKNGDDIWVVNHYSGHLIFEYNRFKKADQNAFKEYDNLLLETMEQPKVAQ